MLAKLLLVASAVLALSHVVVADAEYITSEDPLVERQPVTPPANFDLGASLARLLSRVVVADAEYIASEDPLVERPSVSEDPLVERPSVSEDPLVERPSVSEDPLVERQPVTPPANFDLGVSLARLVPKPTAELQLYMDAACKMPLGDKMTSNSAFSDKCQVFISPMTKMSNLLDCRQVENGDIHLTMKTWMESSTCGSEGTGNLQMSIESVGQPGECAKTTMLRGGEERPIYSRVSCDFDASDAANERAALRSKPSVQF